MTPGHAKAEYGVILDPETLALDTDRTNALRTSRTDEPSS